MKTLIFYCELDCQSVKYNVALTLEIKGINFVFHSIMYLLHYYLTIVTTLGFLLVPVGRCALHPNVYV